MTKTNQVSFACVDSSFGFDSSFVIRPSLFCGSSVFSQNHIAYAIDSCKGFAAFPDECKQRQSPIRVPAEPRQKFFLQMVGGLHALVCLFF